MLDPDKTKIIVGPPGTGKTTKLLDTVEQLIMDGVHPNKICFVAFTRKAAEEAKTRAAAQFGLEKRDLPYFKTLHALAFKQCQVMKREVMGFADFLDIAKMVGIYITFRGAQEDGTISGMSKGDRLFFHENYARADCASLEEHWNRAMFDENIPWIELLQLRETLEKYKEKNGKLDFTDMIQRFLDQDVTPDVDVLIVDEAQDLSMIQWKMVQKIAKTVDKVYIAGDDDQAIFRWAGANVDMFISLQGDVETLEESYRVPANIAKRAEKVINRVSVRRPKRWKSRPVPGVVSYSTGVEHIDMSQGNWLLLARNVFLLEQYNNYCITMGHVFDSHIGSPVKGAAIRAVRNWEQLRKGNRVTAAEACEIYSLMKTRERVKYGFKNKLAEVDEDTLLSWDDLHDSFGLVTNDIWHVALDKMPDVQKTYFIAALKNGEKLLREPRIKVNTIHGVKGGEADNVVVMTDMAQRTYQEYQKNPDDEFRVWYVAMTRAKEKLFIMQPTTRYYFDVSLS